MIIIMKHIYIFEQIYCISNNSVDIAIVANKDTFNKIDTLKAEFNSKIKLYIFDFGENVGYLNAYLKIINMTDTTQYKFTILSNTDITYNRDFYDRLTKIDIKKVLDV